ncbi:NUMOD4 motif-containing HNH endonuclease [Clostridium kluyveri]|uniref:NUMOD4 motif-containing HNH endonuclease n=1 Tax=Clostridium kluyveri TaxID=1534 RepID=UPI00224654FB|nr:NUMOD4 motif-containing HNH endonuclease [Clostridium kluyveri]UZQ49090.1 NUMOD4 motif-containing HNH endonuclease [Clostridium kluyveri]
MKEFWKDIPGYEGRYQASTLGRIRSVDHYVNGKSRYGKPFKRLVKGRILRPGRYNQDGHVSVVLGHKANGSPVHQLIALTFLGDRPKGYDVRHLDGNPQNNKLNNLAYGTRKQNILDVYNQGKAWRNTTKEQALKVKNLLKQGMVCTSIAQITGVSIHSIYAIKQGRCFKWLTC